MYIHVEYMCSWYMCRIEPIGTNHNGLVITYILCLNLPITAVMQDLHDYVNPKNGRHCPMISEETNKIIQDNADVS